jgi:hypothetical protein
VDWGVGSYERIAMQLLPAARVAAANEQPGGFCVTSRYVVATLRRGR